MKTISKSGQSKIVEYEELGQMKRGVLPLDSETIELGIPYGLPFALLLKENHVNSEMAIKIEQELHNRGIWTLSDLKQNTNAAIGAIQAAYALDVQKLLILAKKYGGN
jgi:hypothetical protein